MGSVLSSVGMQTGVKAGIDAFQAGVSSYFKTKTAKVQARTQAYQAEGQGKIAGYNADVIRANKTVQDVENRQQLESMGKALSSMTAGYKEVQGNNAAQAGAANVDISSGSAAKVMEGNAGRYADEYASGRRAYDLQQWNGESTLSMMEAMAKGYNYQQDAYNKTASAYRTVANLQGSAWGNAFASAGISLLGSLIGGDFSGLMNSNTGKVASGGDEYWDPALLTWTSSKPRH